MSTLFFSVYPNMRERIINYLIVKHLEDKEFNAHPHQRVKSAYILAKKEYKELSEAQKEEIIKYIGGKDEGINKEKH